MSTELFWMFAFELHQDFLPIKGEAINSINHRLIYYLEVYV